MLASSLTVAAVADDEHWFGTVFPAKAVSVKSELDGIVESLDVVIGEIVASGQALASLDIEELTTQLTRSSAELRRAQAQVTEEESMVELRDAELHRRRIAGFSISQEELGMAEQLFAAAKAKLAAAQAHLEAVQADHELLLLTQRRTFIVAPIDGVVQERRVRAGDRISAGETMFEIVSPDDLYVRFAIPERARQPVELGQTVWLDGSVAAEVVAIAPGANAVTGLIVAEARLQQAALDLLGRGVRVSPENSEPLSGSGLVLQ